MNATSPKSLMTGRRSSTSLSVICWTPMPSQTNTSKSPLNDCAAGSALYAPIHVIRPPADTLGYRSVAELSVSCEKL